MAGKLKGFNIKGIFVNHGEKMALVIVLGMVVAGLASTDWVPYSRQPAEFITAADNAEKTIEEATWPEAEREKFVLQPDEAPRRIVDMGINDRIAVTPDYVHSQPLWKDKDARDDPLQEPQYLAVVEMVADDARVLIRQGRSGDMLASAGGGDRGVPDDDSGASGFGASPGTAAEQQRPDEFLSPGSRGGGYGGLIDDDDPYVGRAGAGRGRNYTSMEAPELSAGRRGRGSARGRRGGAVDNRMADDDGPSRPTRGRGRRGSSRNARNLLDDDEFDPTAVYGGGRAGGGMTGYAGSGVDAKGYPFVSVRGVFQFREQIRMYTDAIHKSYHEAMQYFMIVDFELQRQRMLNGPDEWTEWEAVNDQVFRDILKHADGFDPEVVDPAVTDAAITCPLPARLTGIYSKQATHPSLKDFTLSPEEMAREVEYQTLLLETAMEQKTQVPEGFVQKRGFADMVFDARSLSQAVYGGASAYGNSFGGGGNRIADEDDEMMGMSAINSFRTGRGGFGGRPGQPGQPQNEMLNKSIDQLLQEWIDKDQDINSEEAKADLRKWISARVQPQGDLLLFRYFDFDVEPGQTYRYRVRLELKNPNYGVPLSATDGVASVRDGATRKTPWSEPTNPIRVDETVKYFLTTVEPPRSQVHPQARMNIFQYDLDVGTVVQSELDVAMGQNIGGRKRAEQADPAKGIVDDVDYTFKSNDLLIDVLPDVRFSRSDHPDLRLPTDSRGLAQIAEVATVVTPHGQIRTVDQVSQQADLEQAKTRKGWQDEQFSHLTDPDAGLAARGGYGYSNLGDEDEEMMGLSARQALGGRNNPLRRGGFGGGGGGGRR